MKPILSLSLLGLCLATFSCEKKAESSAPSSDKPAVTTTETAEPTQPDTNPLRPLSPEEMAADLGMDIDFGKPEDYMAKIVEIINKAENEKDADTLALILGKHALSAEQNTQLRQLIAQHGLQVDANKPFEKIGDLKANQHARWAINLKDNAPIILDVKRDTAGKWRIDKVQLPDSTTLADGTKSPLPNADKDALNYTFTFLSKLLQQDFSSAKAMVDTTNVTDAKLAGLCIIFEEAAYKIDSQKPLRALFMRDRAAGFYANVISSDGKQAAQFSVITQRDSAADSWKVYEINLDQLLGDYAERVSGGDIYYTPLLKNPKGGDSLVIYFEFDSEGLTPRTQKQLSIVTSILKLDPNKTIHISGHTDAVGARSYNEMLSGKRAQSVKEYFLEHGVAASQIITESHGALIPRQPNTLADGTDNPDGRRANRRTEIYLDF